MLHVGVKDRVGAEMGRTNIITIDHRLLRDGDFKFSKKRTYPTQFSSNGSNISIFSFSGRTNNGLLLLGTP